MTDYIFWSFPNGGTNNLIFPCKWYLTIEVLVRLTVITHDDCLSLQGCGFLCVSKDNQHMIKPLVVSSGFTAGFNSQFIWTGKTNAAFEFPIMNNRLPIKACTLYFLISFYRLWIHNNNHHRHHYHHHHHHLYFYSTFSKSSIVLYRIHKKEK